MEFLKKIFSSMPTSHREKYYVFQVKCNRCGEILEGRVDLYNDLSAEYEGANAVYFGRKVLMSSGGQCFQQIEVELKFDGLKHLIQKHAQGGTFV